MSVGKDDDPMTQRSILSSRLFTAAVTSAAVFGAGIAQAEAGAQVLSCYQPLHHPAQYRTATKRVMVQSRIVCMSFPLATNLSARRFR